MPIQSTARASIEEIKLLYNRAQGHHIFYDEKNEESRKIEAFLLQAGLLEGVLVSCGLQLLKSNPKLSALKGKRNKWYGYDNAINDLYLLAAITTEQFKKLEQFKSKRNEYIHNLLSKKINMVEGELHTIYEEYKDLVWDMILKLERSLEKNK